MAEKPFVRIFDIIEATGLKKWQDQRAWFGNFETHPTSQSGLGGDQTDANVVPP
jgi:hypothetical protein